MIDLSPMAETVLQTLGRWLDRPPGEVALAARTIVIGILANVSCALLGCYLVLRRMSLLGDAISHAVLPGLAIGFFLSGEVSVLPMFLGALAFGMLTAFLTQTLSTYGRLPEDSSMGVVFTSLFALGVILISRVGRMHLDTDCVLEGAIEFAAIDTMSLAGLEVPLTLRSLGPVLLLTVAFVAILWKELQIASFDPLLSTAMGLSAGLVHYLLMGMVATVTVASFEAVGSILVIAMLIVPGATAHLLTDRLGWMLLWAALVGVFGAVFGYAGAVYFNTSAAGMMAVAVGVQFAAAVFLAPRHGLLSKAWGQLKLALRIVSEDILAMLYRWEEKQAGSARPARLTRPECRKLLGGGAVVRTAMFLLQRRRQVAAEPDGTLRLTEDGRHVAETLVRSHRLWESYLDEYFDLPPDHLHEPAEQIEHFVGPLLQSRLARELEDPATDPHGQSIPPGERPESYRHADAETAPSRSRRADVARQGEAPAEPQPRESRAGLRRDPDEGRSA